VSDEEFGICLALTTTMGNASTTAIQEADGGSRRTWADEFQQLKAIQAAEYKALRSGSVDEYIQLLQHNANWEENKEAIDKKEKELRIRLYHLIDQLPGNAQAAVPNAQELSDYRRSEAKAIGEYREALRQLGNDDNCTRYLNTHQVCGQLLSNDLMPRNALYFKATERDPRTDSPLIVKLIFGAEPMWSTNSHGFVEITSHVLTSEGAMAGRVPAVFARALTTAVCNTPNGLDQDVFGSQTDAASVMVQLLQDRVIQLFLDRMRADMGVDWEQRLGKRFVNYTLFELNSPHPDPRVYQNIRKLVSGDSPLALPLKTPTPEALWNWASNAVLGTKLERGASYLSLKMFTLSKFGVSWKGIKPGQPEDVYAILIQCFVDSFNSLKYNSFVFLEDVSVPFVHFGNRALLNQNQAHLDVMWGLVTLSSGLLAAAHHWDLHHNDLRMSRIRVRTGMPAKYRGMEYVVFRLMDQVVRIPYNQFFHNLAIIDMSKASLRIPGQRQVKTAAYGSPVDVDLEHQDQYSVASDLFTLLTDILKDPVPPSTTKEELKKIKKQRRKRGPVALAPVEDARVEILLRELRSEIKSLTQKSKIETSLNQVEDALMKCIKGFAALYGDNISWGSFDEKSTFLEPNVYDDTWTSDADEKLF